MYVRTIFIRRSGTIRLICIIYFVFYYLALDLPKKGNNQYEVCNSIYIVFNRFNNTTKHKSVDIPFYYLDNCIVF